MTFNVFAAHLNKNAKITPHSNFRVNIFSLCFFMKSNRDRADIGMSFNQQPRLVTGDGSGRVFLSDVIYRRSDTARWISLRLSTFPSRRLTKFKLPPHSWRVRTEASYIYQRQPLSAHCPHPGAFIRYLPPGRKEGSSASA